MKKPIQTRLRNCARCGKDPCYLCKVLTEAATYIDQLEVTVDGLEEELDELTWAIEEADV